MTIVSTRGYLHMITSHNYSGMRLWKVAPWKEVQTWVPLSTRWTSDEVEDDCLAWYEVAPVYEVAIQTWVPLSTRWRGEPRREDSNTGFHVSSHYLAPLWPLITLKFCCCCKEGLSGLNLVIRPLCFCWNSSGMWHNLWCWNPSDFVSMSLSTLSPCPYFLISKFLLGLLLLEVLLRMWHNLGTQAGSCRLTLSDNSQPAFRHQTTYNFDYKPFFKLWDLLFSHVKIAIFLQTFLNSYWILKKPGQALHV